MLSGTLVTVAGFIPIAIAKSATGEYAFAFFQNHGDLALSSCGRRSLVIR